MLLTMFSSILLSVPSLAAGKDAALPAQPSRMEDLADLLTEEEEDALRSRLDEISERQKLDVVVVTADSLDGKTPMEYADDFFDDNGYGFGADRDGTLLLVSMAERDWWISTSGYGITVFTDWGIEYLSEQFLPELSDGDYAEAFDVYADWCDSFITEARENRPYDTDHMPEEPFPFGMYLMISLVVGGIIAFLYVGSLKAQLKTVRSQSGAREYVRQGSMNVKESRDLFLFAQTVRREKPKSSSGSGGGSSTHISSSGSSHGGGGGKF